MNYLRNKKLIANIITQNKTGKKIKNLLLEFPLWLRRLRTQLVSMRMQVQPLALLSSLRIQCCRKLRHRSQMQLGSGSGSCCGWGIGLSWALVRPLAQKRPHAAGEAVKRIRSFNSAYPPQSWSVRFSKPWRDCLQICFNYGPAKSCHKENSLKLLNVS